MSCPVAGAEELKRTNETGMAMPLLEGCEIAGKDVTADALLTQRTLASYLVGREAHYHLVNRGHWAIESVHYIIEPELR